MAYKLKMGFCSKCGICREDAVYEDGVRLAATDCACTVLLVHRKDCMYTRFVGAAIYIAGCAIHHIFPCESCDCTCEGHYQPEMQTADAEMPNLVEEQL